VVLQGVGTGHSRLRNDTADPSATNLSFGPKLPAWQGRQVQGFALHEISIQYFTTCRPSLEEACGL
jgi:hypothetical protein